MKRAVAYVAIASMLAAACNEILGNEVGVYVPGSGPGVAHGGSAGSAGMGGGGAPACALDQECPAPAPYCVAGTCRSCTELPMPCSDIDPTRPVCDADTGVCAPCAEHDDCASGACRIATGECFDDDNRLWVDADADCQAAAGTELEPFCTVGEALQTVNVQPAGTAWAVFVAGSATPYELLDDASLPDRPFALIGPSVGLTATLHGDPPYHLAVFGEESDHYLARFTLGGALSDGTILDCVSSKLWIDDCTIWGGVEGLRVRACEIWMRRSLITNATSLGAYVEAAGQLTVDIGEMTSNAGGLVSLGATTLRRTTIADNYLEGGVDARSGTLSMSNCIMLGNGYNIGHVRVGSSVDASLRYVVALGGAMGDVYNSLSCDPIASGGSYDVRNSIVASVDGASCGSVNVEQSLVAPGSEGLGAGNHGFPLQDYDLVFVDHESGDVHVLPNPPSYLLGIATRSSSDPAIDFDGDPRPPIDADDYPGVDAAP